MRPDAASAPEPLSVSLSGAPVAAPPFTVPRSAVILVQETEGTVQNLEDAQVSLGGDRHTIVRASAAL
jgi:hypothetical protein